MDDPRYLALRAAIDADPALAGLPDAEVAAALGAPVPGPRQSIVPSQVLRWAARAGRYERIRQAATAYESPGDPGGTQLVRGLAGAALRLFDLGVALDVADPEVLALVDALAAFGLIDQADHADLLARGDTTTTRARQIAGWGLPATEHDITAARSL